MAMIEKGVNNLWRTLIELLGLVFVTNFARSLGSYLCEYFQYGDIVKFFQLFLNNIFPVLIVLMYVRYGEKRTISSLGFTPKNWIKSYLQGALIGVLLIAGVAVLSILFGEIEFVGLSKSYSLVALVATSLLSIVNVREELIFRGWFLTTPYSVDNPAKAIVWSSIVFGLIHCGNPNVTALSIVNLILFSVLLSEIFLICKNIWVVAAIHTVWNFLQGKILGLPVSGSKSNTRLLDFNIAPNSLTDGFGLEGNVFTLIILVVAIAIATRKIVYLRKVNL
ncbi:MAG: CPBP family intramembrane metalloprotease [Alistipes sp.]|nr:CPBP family intramembrane metalloprotease [Alistipes sp.]